MTGGALKWAVLAAAVLLAGCGSESEPAAAVAAPVDLGNRWALVEPEAEGIDGAALANAGAQVEKRYGNVTSLLVARGGRLVFERYYHGVTRPTNAPVHSITKSVVSALVGIALRDGELEDLGDRVTSYLPNVAPFVIDEDARKITVRNLLTMSAGWVVTGLAPTGTGVDVLAAPDPAIAAFGRPLLARPGTRFGYDNASTHLLSIVLAEATGTPTDDLAARELFAPLRIRRPLWERDANGVALGATGLHLSPRDLAKLGQLFLQRGRWGGKQLLPRRYAVDATRPHVAVGQEDEGYGYLWWATRGPADAGPRSYAAVGAGGQLVVVFPSLEAVVVVTSHPAEEAGGHAADLVYDFVLPAIRSSG